MSELVERLRVALDEAEKQTLAATPGPWLAGTTAEHLVYGQSTWPNHLTHVCNTEYSGRQGPMNAAFIAAWDPARVLRLIERDRLLLEQHDRIRQSRDDAESTSTARTVRSIQLETLDFEFQRAAEFWLGDNHG